MIFALIMTFCYRFRFALPDIMRVYGRANFWPDLSTPHGVCYAYTTTNSTRHENIGALVVYKTSCC